MLTLAVPAPPQATKRTRFSSFPPYLLVQMRRYYTSQSWEPKKQDVSLGSRY